MTTKDVHWVCPHCEFAQIVPLKRMFHHTIAISITEVADGPFGFVLYGKACSNPACLKLTASAYIGQYQALGNGQGYLSSHGAGGQLLPRGDSKPQPAYIPLQLREDYEQACAIRELSPKAAATLVRRCLQGMIRDFCGIKNQPTLFKEIDALRKMVEIGSAPGGVTIESVEAIDHVRGIGNIGAHMEKDVDHIVDVDPNEAQALIELVEMLFDEWYVARHKRAARLAHITTIATSKVEARSSTMDSPQGPRLDAEEQKG